MNAASIRELFLRLTAMVRAVAHEAIVVFTSSDGALLQTMLIVSVGIGAGLLKAWGPPTLAKTGWPTRR
jgi:hypothetical protein